MIHSISKKKVILLLIILFIFPIICISFFKNEFFVPVGENEVNIKTNSISIENFSTYLPALNYEALNELWYNQKLEMLIIINDSSYIDAVTPLIEWKNYKGVKTIALYNYSEYEGRDKAEKIRNMIKSYYVSDNIKWVLLAGDAEENLIPIRYVYNPDTAEIDGESEYIGDEYYKPTDFYYADLTGTWDDNNNNKFGESASKSGSIDEISWIPEVYIGRLPADSPSELSEMINKTLDYEKAINIGNWMNKMLLVGGVSSFSPLEDEARLTEYIWQNYALSEMNFTHLTNPLSSFTPATPPYPNKNGDLNSTSFKDGLNSGYSTIIFAGHGNTIHFTDASGVYYSNSDALSSSNFNMSSLIYADMCTTSSYDQGDTSVGERLIKRPYSGAIGYIGGLRVTWYFEGDLNLEKLNRGNAKLFWEDFFEEKKFQQGKALYDSKVSYLNSDYFNQPSVSTEQEWERKNLLTYSLLGDPEVDIYTNEPKSALNPFKGSFYEGQLISIQIRDISNNIVPYARINLRTEDGKNRTVYSDKYGNLNFRIPAQANENYTILITGHNLIPSYYNFTTLADSDQPEITKVIRYPNSPTISDNICFSIETKDNYSGIESVFLLLSKNNFHDLSIYSMYNGFQENNFDFNLTLNKLEPGDYSYAFIARDYSNKTTLLAEDSFSFIIQRPFSDFALILSSIMIIGLAGISSVILIMSVKKYQRISTQMK
ncbi:MAG: C25 family cysteine peptidase [Candidatus Thorarchaeota archaeon]